NDKYQDKDIADNTYYTYTVTDSDAQMMKIPVRRAFLANVTPVKKGTSDPIPGLKPVQVVAVEGQKSLVQFPGYTATSVNLEAPTGSEKETNYNLPVDLTTTGTD